MNVHTYVLKNDKTISGIVQEINRLLDKSENMETQMWMMEDQSVIIQGRVRGGEYKKLVGLDRAITLRIIPVGETDVTIETSHQRWMNKGAAAMAGLLFTWPLLATAVYSTYKQYKLPETIHAAVESYLADCPEPSSEEVTVIPG